MICHRCRAPAIQSIVTQSGTFPLCQLCMDPVVAHLTSTPTMRRDAIRTPFPVLSRGKVFQAMTCGESFHPSWWCFSDELETREAWWTIQPGDIVADVGADFGSYTLSALAQGAAHVYAWSPPFKHPTEAIEADTLARSAALNGWGDGRLSLYPTGLYSTTGWLAAFDGPRPAQFFVDPIAAHMAARGAPGNCSAFPVHKLDDARLERLDWLKVDAEGCEAAILIGAEQTLRRCKPRVILEHHYHIDPDCETKCRAFLGSLGYEQEGETRPHGVVAHSLYRVAP